MTFTVPDKGFTHAGRFHADDVFAAALLRLCMLLGETELAAIAKVQEIFRSKNLIPCTGCRYCTDGCPKQIAIPELFATMNAKQIYHDWHTDYYYNAVYALPGHKASDCVKCGKCESVCPQHLPIRQLLENVANEFEKKEA